MLKRNLLLVSLLVLSLAFVGCIGPFAKKEAAKIEVGAEPTEVNIVDGDVDVKLTAAVKDKKDKVFKVDEKDVKWEITKGADLAELDKETGTEVTLTAKAVGKVTVTVKYEELKPATVEITITDKETEEPGEDEDPVEDANLILFEDFTGATADNFFTADYKSLPDDETKPMYIALAGQSEMTITEGSFEFGNGRLAVGALNDTATTANDTKGNGSLDLSKPYVITIEFGEASNPQADKKFQIQIDNNTAGAANSMHSSPRIFNEVASTLSNTTKTIKSDVGTANSQILIRAENGAVVEIKSIKIEYQ